eukprot:9678229-Alexandrium_andersonii.AAC.1
MHSGPRRIGASRSQADARASARPRALARLRAALDKDSAAERARAQGHLVSLAGDRGLEQV